MAQQIQEKSRYKILREFGYSAKEAQKFRRYGYDKFLKKLSEKAETEVLQNRLGALTRVIGTEEQQTQRRIKKIIGDRNQLRKFNYICETIYEDRQGKTKTQYVTLKTDRMLTRDEVYKELYNLSWFYRDSYDMKRIKGYRITGVKVRP